MSATHPGAVTAGSRRAGRRPVTSRVEIEHIALDMFTRRGFDTTTVDDIAAAAGIGRRTVFRYYASKNDIPWGAFDEQLDRMRATFAALPPDLPVMDGVRAAVLDFNEVPAEEQHWHRRRLRLILDTPALQAHSTLRYAAWRRVVADYVAARLGTSSDDLVPQAVGHASLGVALAAYERWLDHGDGELRDLLDAVFRALGPGLAGPLAGEARPAAEGG
ncbi:mycofactocin system transcriptional regulator [Pseudonocardia hydrocarbonoxydans]|uniref:Putative transcriptional regulatory protein TetR n=1 Tax=Pseudonocardia hydrocarbonoxydans TaxID=76726 RepID=A0A4Y3WQY8_9PSEU|nr:mycofactocin system transcriptional regulator [Pseudonocardia hydrocarbonoxydans]GEC21194.1 putative transcriptional regulatory protein TetR [Pseudonocardia hydrocarbonoxydans]